MHRPVWRFQCDAAGCDQFIIVDGETVAEGKRAIEAQGWHVVDGVVRYDLCPEHFYFLEFKAAQLEGER